MKDKVIVGPRRVSLPVPAAGAVLVPCRKCRAPVWVSPATIAMVGGDYDVECVECAYQTDQEAVDALEAAPIPSQGQADEFSKMAGRPFTPAEMKAYTIDKIRRRMKSRN